MPIAEGLVRQFTFDCVERLTSSTTLEGVAAELKRAGEALGFESFCISGLPPPGEPVNPYLMLSGWPEGWHHRYAEMGYVHADPVARLLRRTTMPFQWSEAFYRPDDLEARRVMDESVEFGLVQVSRFRSTRPRVCRRASRSGRGTWT